MRESSYVRSRRTTACGGTVFRHAEANGPGGTAQVVEHLRHDLLSGRFAPGTRLNEVELAAEFEISRGPLREAVQCLVSEGLVEHRPNRGAIVPVPTAASVTGFSACTASGIRRRARIISAASTSSTAPSGVSPDTVAIIAGLPPS